MTRPARPFIALALCEVLLCFLSARPADAADRELKTALKERDTSAIVARFRTLAEESEVTAAREIPPAVAVVEEEGDGAFHIGDRARIFTSAVGVLSRLRTPEGHAALKQQMERAKDAPARLIALHAGIQIRDVDGVDWALAALPDEDPLVSAAAARALGFSKEITPIDALIDAMERWEKEGTSEKLTSGRKAIAADMSGRAWLACRDALERLTGESMHAARGYRTYVRAHRDEIDPKNIDLSERREKRTGLGLFGLEITGKNIAFILDVSGSMMTTDPLTPEQIAKLRRSTGVGDENPLEKAMLEDRRRIVRAKKELRKVIEGLGEDRSFTVIAYSTEVNPWKPMLVPAAKKQRDEGVTFIEGLEAQGITVTDMALNQAFHDPSIDTIYLITDGAPTHIGSRGPDLPADAPDLMARILKETKAVNLLRGVRIFTLGFEGAEEGFLEKLSEENHGRYLRIE